MRGLVERFVVVDAEGQPVAADQDAPAPPTAGWKNRAATLEKTTSAEKPWIFRHAHPPRISRNLGVVPFDREGDRCVAQHAEVVAVMRVFRNPLARKDQVLPKRLLEAGMEFIAKAGTQRVRLPMSSREEADSRQDAAPSAGKNQIFVERRFQRARVGNAKNRIGFLDVVSDSNPRLGLPRGGETVVEDRRASPGSKTSFLW